MNIENEIFKRSVVNFEKLEFYGFQKENNKYVYHQTFLNGSFKAIIIVDNNVFGKIIDLDTDEEYTNIRTDMSGEFVNKVREEYKKILIDIKENCFEKKYFITAQANRIAECIKNNYDTDPEFLWDKLPGCGVFRNSCSNKWYGIIMNIDLSKIDTGTGEIEVLNVKLDENKIPILLKKNGYYPAYHMSKKDWISIILNGTISDDEIMSLIDESYNLVK